MGMMIRRSKMIKDAKAAAEKQAALHDKREELPFMNAPSFADEKPFDEPKRRGRRSKFD